MKDLRLMESSAWLGEFQTGKSKWKRQCCFCSWEVIKWNGVVKDEPRVRVRVRVRGNKTF